ncbi:hypothetical protein BCV69DRAFT_280027 [Microstroma glucosiphilum]|uniref:LuxS/MPP-like metallohydrolase n=1 Tax=Pseudomicrostroma glucosiphilum TaxID=1684307 RepID=A0A316ULP9_9BASI|nr:hypothetical protein BCV69DRAFT_280027 [Pseudomicrostroma glucosiphilum]PWN24125.1 hypothetical protein BCV69DRAFT_280027 [Pseudomicrostroma glucosiphilum]
MRVTTSLLSRSLAGPSRQISLSPAGVARALSAAASAKPNLTSRSIATPPPSYRVSSPPRAGPVSSALPRRSYSVDSSPITSASLIKTSTLPNGVRVATEGTPGHFSAVGVYVDTGSRYERPWISGESGVSHLLDRMAFKSTSQRSSEVMTSEIEKLGGNVMCSSSRETIMYQSSMFNQDLPAVLSILADTIQHPLLLPEELDAQRQAAAYEIQEIWNKPEMILPELLHLVAYKDNTLGNPLLCPIESLEQMTADNLRSFMKQWYTPERIVVAGAGMQHEQLVALSEQFFGGAAAKQSVLTDSSSRSSSRSSSPSSVFSSSSSGSSTSTSPSSASSYNPSADFSTTAKTSASHLSDIPGFPTSSDLAQTRARYTGGELYLPREDLEFTHVYVAFEGVSIHDDDIYALATLQILLGGGSSFSAGGPGKGMYSRLYGVLNTHHAVDFCSAFLHSYSDSALFGIAASCEPRFNASIGNVIARQLELCTGPLRGGITTAELSRARNQLKSSLMMALESRLVEVEDLGRQVQVHGKKVTVEEMCEKIDQVDLPRLHRVATRVLRPTAEKEGKGQKMNYGLGSGQTTVVAQGNLEGLGDLRQMLYSRGLGAKPTSQA